MESKDYFNADILLYLYNSKTKTIITSLVEKNKLTSDAEKLDSIKIDVANYKINATETAFGIRVFHIGSSRPNPYNNTEELYLYFVDKGKLKSISDEILTYEYSAEWDMYCSLEGEETNSILIMDSKMTNGYYNIKVKSTKTILKSVPPKNEDDDCIEENTTLAPVTQILTFKNGKYR